MITKNGTVLVGVSGGPDSMALLHFYHSIKDEWGLHVIAVTVDHQLRGAASVQDVNYVKEVCNRWGIPVEEATVDVKQYKKQFRLSTQMAARVLRYDVFEHKMKECNGDYLALGHHGDDQVETMFMEWLRQASSSSVLGIPTKRAFANGFIVRPFLCVTKANILHYCDKHKINPRIDPSNDDTTYTRNDIRKNLIPFMKRKNANIHHTIQRLSETLQEDEAYLQKEAKKMIQTVVTFNDANRTVSFNKKTFITYPNSLQRRAYHLILNYLYDRIPDHLTYVHEEIFFDMLRTDQSNMEVDFPLQLKAEKVYETINFYFTNKNTSIFPFESKLTTPGRQILPNGQLLSITYTNTFYKGDENTYLCSSQAITLPLTVRTRKNGDRMRIPGLNGSKKIKDILIDEKIPPRKRDELLLITDAKGEILWIMGLKKGEPKKNVKKPPYIQCKIISREKTEEDKHA